jgi:formylglycine-generating enzyme required for sulfatase activity
MANRLRSQREVERVGDDALLAQSSRAGTSGPYAGSLDAMGWYNSNSGSQTHEVAQKQPNAWGLYDMHGNVFEWCLDGYAESLPGGSVTDPLGPSSLGVAARGGSCALGAFSARSAFRVIYTPGMGMANVGFRIALAPSP